MLKRPGGDRQRVDVPAPAPAPALAPALALRHDEHVVLSAVEPAPEPGAPAKTRVLNLLHRLTDAAPGPPRATPRVPPPEGPAPSSEPRADAGRHDGLLARERVSRNAS